MDFELKTIEDLSAKLFNPFEINNDDIYYPLCDIDPDAHYFNELNAHISQNCNYYYEHSFSSVIQSRFPNIIDHKVFSLCHINIRSQKANLRSFEMCLENLQFNFSVIGISETWLNDYNFDLYNINGYNFVEAHRSGRSGGGVGIFLVNDIIYQERPDLTQDNNLYESIFVEIDKDVFHKNRNIIIGVIYRPPDTDLGMFNENITDLFDTLGRERKYCYLMGDFNINLLNFDKHAETTSFVDLLHANSFVSLINRPTRVTTNSATLIDNIFTNCYGNIENTFQCLIYTDVSDHFPIVHIDSEMKLCDIDSVVTRRNLSYKNRQRFYESISSLDWGAIYSESDTQTAFSLFHSTLLKHFHINFPKQTVKIQYNNRKPWLTQGLKDSIKMKNKLYRKYLKVKSAANEMNYKNYRNKLHHLIKIAEKRHYSELLNECQDNIKKTWQIIKNIVNKNKASQLQTKFKLNDGSFTTDGYVISNKFNDFFVNIGPNLAAKIPEQNLSPLDFMDQPLLNSIYLSEVTSEEINNILKSLKNGAAGYDELNACLLKHISPFITEPLKYLSNLSLSEGIFPTELKLANVIPLYKADDAFLFNNYRPVSLLCVISKVFEKVMYNRLIDFLETFAILNNSQFGFRKMHSTHMALMTLMNRLISSLENDEYILGIFLDFSNAFDTVDHVILLKKLAHYGIRGTALKWFESYLSNREQYVTYNGISSSKQRIKCGVPQGSILGPLLFLIYINDLCLVCKHTSAILFADDTNLFTSGKDLKSLEITTNSELSRISLWLKVNKLSLNIKKTHYMIFCRRKKLCHDVKLLIDGQAINEVQKTKFLGIIIDNQLTWKWHINYIAGKIARGIGMLIKARQFLNKVGLMSLYYSFIYPYLTYCNHIWGATYKTRLKRLVILQNKAIRVLAQAGNRTSSDPLYKKLNIMKLENINTYLIGRFMFCVSINKVPQSFGSLFRKNNEFHNYETRSAHHLHLPSVKLDLSKTGIKYRGAIVWNLIAQTGINLEVSEAVFKKSLIRLINTDGL